MRPVIGSLHFVKIVNESKICSICNDHFTRARFGGCTRRLRKALSMRPVLRSFHLVKIIDNSIFVQSLKIIELRRDLVAVRYPKMASRWPKMA